MPPLLYRPTPVDYNQVYQHFEQWQLKRELTGPLHQDLWVWFQGVQADLSSEEQTALKTLLNALLQWRFDTRLTPAQLSSLQNTVKKSLATLESLAQARKLTRTNQDIIKE